MAIHKKQAVDAAVRTNFMAFVIKIFENLNLGEQPLTPSEYLQAICWLFEQQLSMEGGRHIIEVPPRHLKSIIASVAFPAWMLGKNPSASIMIACYSEGLLRQHASDFKRVITSAWYQRLFPALRIAKDGDRLLHLKTTKGGGRQSVSVNGTVTGFGADIIILDDCMKAEGARSEAERQKLFNWYDSTISTRLDNPNKGAIISIQQRLHEYDLPAYLKEKGFETLSLPAIAEKDEHIATGRGRHWHRKVGDLLNPERQSRDLLEMERRTKGPQVFSAQYQQNPVTLEGNMIRLEWFGRYDEAHDRSWYHKVIQSWDTAVTDSPRSDYSVCTTWGFRDKKWYLLDVYRNKLEYPKLRSKVLQLYWEWKPDKVLIEDASSGKSLEQELRAKGPFKPLMIPPRGDKVERVNGCLGEIEAGHILLPSEAPWLETLCSELRAFPDGRHDDQVDSISQFIIWQLKNWKRLLEERRPDGRLKELVRNRDRPW